MLYPTELQAPGYRLSGPGEFYPKRASPFKASGGGNGGNSRHVGLGWPLIQDRFEQIQGARCPRGVDLHGSVPPVGHPTHQSEASRLIQNEVAEPHALHPTRDTPRPRLPDLHAFSVTEFHQTSAAAWYTLDSGGSAMRPMTIRVLALLVALALASVACGRKGDPSPRRSPQNVPPSSSASLSPGAIHG